ncbi:OmpA family protein, partial [Actinomadura sp. 6K520]|uniref:OmpA family protein n=1 Tax=Actinomadura sp. 6K520 TaxID=2530364 RepID=UPI001404B406
MLLIAGVIGLPGLLLLVTGSPIPRPPPSFDDIGAGLSHRADETLLLEAAKYLAWTCWAGWTLLVFTEAAAQIIGGAVPRIPGLTGLQRSAAVLVGSLGIAAIGATAPISRTIMPPPVDPGTTASAPPPPTAPSASDTPAPSPSTNTQWADAQVTSDLASAPKHLFVHHSQRTETIRSLQQHHIVVQFAFDATHLSRPAQDAITQAARDIRDNGDPSHPITIVGHTDAVGPASYNQRLSRQRADAVRQALSRALPREYMLQVSGKGETAPLAAESHPDGRDNPTGRARNRRAEITYTAAASANPRPPQTPPSRPTTPPRQSPQTPTTEPPT